jgi:hypothetical protein
MNQEQKKETYLKEMSIIKQSEQLKELCNRAIQAMYVNDYAEAAYNLTMVSRGIVYTDKDLTELRGLA